MTVTDANLVLGQLDPDGFLGGRMRLDREAAERAIDEQIAQPLGLTTIEAAVGIRRIVDADMAGLLRQLTIGRGHDPRDFVLYAYGGAGPLHCCAYGAELGVGRIVIPATSMVQSAYGALASDLHYSAERSFLLRGGGGLRAPWEGFEPDVLESPFGELELRCHEELAREGVGEAEIELSRSVDMCYRRQTHELVIPVPAERLDAEFVRDLIARFETTYEDTYGKGAGFREAGIEITTFRVDAVGRLPKPLLRSVRREDAALREERQRDVWDSTSGAVVSTPLVAWEAMSPGLRVHGPVVIEHPTTTVVVPGDHHVRADDLGNLIIESGGLSG